MAIGHAAGIASTAGITGWIAATAIAGCNLFGSLFSGWLSDRVSHRIILTTLPLLSTIALLALSIFPEWTLALLGVVGFAYGGTIAAYPAAIAIQFPGEDGMSNTILPVLRTGTDPNSLGNQMFVPQTFEGNIEDRDHVIDVFNRHNASVQAAFGPERLLTYHLGAGWEPLCSFLGVDVPETPYPRGNSSDEFDDNFDDANAPRLGAQT